MAITQLPYDLRKYTSILSKSFTKCTICRENKIMKLNIIASSKICYKSKTIFRSKAYVTLNYLLVLVPTYIKIICRFNNFLISLEF